MNHKRHDQELQSLLLGYHLGLTDAEATDLAAFLATLR